MGGHFLLGMAHASGRSSFGHPLQLSEAFVRLKPRSSYSALCHVQLQRVICYHRPRMFASRLYASACRFGLISLVIPAEPRMPSFLAGDVASA